MNPLLRVRLWARAPRLALIIAFAMLLASAGEAAAQGHRKHRSRRRPKKPAPAAPAPAPTPAPTPAAAPAAPLPVVSDDEAPAPGGKGKSGKGGKKEQVFDFTGLELAGSMRMPQLLYFLDRAEEELDRASLERRSFVPEMVRSLDEESL